MNNQLYLHLYVHLKGPPHLVIHLRSNQITDLHKCPKISLEEKKIKNNKLHYSHAN